MNNPIDPNDKKTYCDVCCLTPDNRLVWTGHARLAVVDGPTRAGQGHWAYMCEIHLETAGYGKDYRGNVDIKGRRDGR